MSQSIFKMPANPPNDESWARYDPPPNYIYSSQPYHDQAQTDPRHHHHSESQAWSPRQPPMPLVRNSSFGSMSSSMSYSDPNYLDRFDSASSGSNGRFPPHHHSHELSDPHFSPPIPPHQLPHRDPRKRHGEAPPPHVRQRSFAALESEEGDPRSPGRAPVTALPSIYKLCCATCNKVFLKEDDLREHQKSHPEDRPYHCPICSHTFNRLHDLERHTMTGERPHTCDECGRRFARAYTMARHKTGSGGCAGKRQAQRGPKPANASPSDARSPPQPLSRDRPPPPPPSMSWFDHGSGSTA